VFEIEIPNEQRLVERLRNGENGAMREFYSLYADQLTAVCSRYIPDADNMKDVFQESLIRIFTHIADFSYQGAGSLRAWASRIVINEALRFLKETKHHELVLLEHDVAEESEADDPPIEEIPPDEIQRMVSQLPTGYRTIFNLYVFENRSHQEIASQLGIKERSSASQLSRAKNLLTKMIRDYNDKHHPR
jgi:RNA polymerase sigma-70 factor (ECF subfamily)